MTHLSGAPARRHLLLGLACSAVFCAALPVLAQDYPNKPVELVVSAAAGGGTDAVARTFSEAARTHFSQPIVVVNKPGAASSIGFTDVALSKKDGYKMGVISVNLAILPALNLTKVTVEDYSFIARLNNDPSAITVAADAPWKSIEEFLATAKQAPEKIRVGNAGTGDAWHVAALALEEKTGTRFTHIPYQGGNPAVLSLLGGHLDAVTVSPGEVAQHVAAGKLRVLAVMADARMPGLFANTPTLKERGIDLLVGGWRGLAAPKGTPPEALAVLREAMARTLREPALRETMAKQNMGEGYLDEANFKSLIARDNATFRELIQRLGIKPA